MDVDECHNELTLPPSYPLPLVGFVCFLAIICGFVVMGVHYAILYAGCPLGLNGCNSFLDKEEKGFFLIRWVQTTSGGRVPEDVVYIVAAFLGALVFTELIKCLPGSLAFQVRGGGTVQALVAVANGERITLTAAVLRILASSVYLGTSGTLGMDGPAIQVCTAVTTFIGWRLGMRAAATQSLLACLGFAGGFAASFNSPLAGIMFAVEELQHVSTQVSRHIICVILMTSVTATTVARLCGGDASLFDADWGVLDKVFGKHMWMLISVPIGIVCSLFGYGISKALDRTWLTIDFLKRGLSEQCVVIIMVVFSALLGSVAFQITGFRGVWGIGYESLQHAFDKDVESSKFFVFACAKALAMVVSIAARCPGDLLEPVLISGAFLGGGVGSLLELLVDDEALASEIVKPCIVFGMVGLFASCFRFPLTPLVIVLEFMGEETYALVLPAAVAGFTAITVSNKLFPPLLDIVMHRDGINLERISEETFSDSTSSKHTEEPEEDFIDSEQQSQASTVTKGSRMSHASAVMAHIGPLLESSMLSLASHSRASSRSNTRTTSSGSTAGIGTVPSPTQDPSPHTGSRGSSSSSGHASQPSPRPSVRSSTGQTSLPRSRRGSNSSTITSLGIQGLSVVPEQRPQIVAEASTLLSILSDHSKAMRANGEGKRSKEHSPREEHQGVPDCGQPPRLPPASASDAASASSVLPSLLGRGGEELMPGIPAAKPEQAGNDGAEQHEGQHLSSLRPSAAVGEELMPGAPPAKEDGQQDAAGGPQTGSASLESPPLASASLAVANLPPA